MEEIKRYTFGKTEKLKSRKVIEQLFKAGNSFSVYPFRVLYLIEVPSLASNNEAAGLINTNTLLLAGFAVGSRHFKKATDRNRIKRLMREGWRLQKNILQSPLALHQKHVSVFVIYTGKEIPGFNLVFDKMAIVFKRLYLLTFENR